MFISREYDYALRILRILDGNGRLSVGQICEAEHVPQPYAYKILKKLEKASILKSRRGTQGGYELTADLATVSLYDVYKAVEGELYLNECMKDGFRCPNNEGGKHCRVHVELCGMQEKFAAQMKARSIKDVLGVERAE